MAQVLVFRQRFANFISPNYILPVERPKLEANSPKTTFLSIPAGLSASPQLQQVMCGANQRPLAAAGFKSTPHEAVETSNILNLPEHRLDRSASPFVQFPASLGTKFSFHQLRRRQAQRYPTSRRSILHGLSLLPILLRRYQ